jgi:hypothetical protein
MLVEHFQLVRETDAVAGEFQRGTVEIGVARLAAILREEGYRAPFATRR